MGMSISLYGVFYLSLHRHQVEGTSNVWCLFRKTQATWGERNCACSEITEDRLVSRFSRWTVRVCENDASVLIGCSAAVCGCSRTVLVTFANLSVI